MTLTGRMRLQVRDVSRPCQPGHRGGPHLPSKRGSEDGSRLISGSSPTAKQNVVDAKAFNWLSRENGTHARVQAFHVGQVPLDGRRLAFGKRTQRTSFPQENKLYALARAPPWQMIGSITRQGEVEDGISDTEAAVGTGCRRVRHGQRPGGRENADAASLRVI